MSGRKLSPFVMYTAALVLVIGGLSLTAVVIQSGRDVPLAVEPTTAHLSDPATFCSWAEAVASELMPSGDAQPGPGELAVLMVRTDFERGVGRGAPREVDAALSTLARTQPMVSDAIRDLPPGEDLGSVDLPADYLPSLAVVQNAVGQC